MKTGEMGGAYSIHGGHEEMDTKFWSENL